MAQTLYLDTLPDQTITPSLVYSTEKLLSTYTGSAIRVRKQSTSTEQNIGFTGDHLNTSALDTFTSSDAYAKVITIYDQTTGNRHMQEDTDIAPPRIKDKQIGPARAVIFESGTQGSEVDNLFGLKTEALSGLNLGRDYSVFAVLRPTSSWYTHQNSLNIGTETFLSLEEFPAGALIGSPTFGSNQIPVINAAGVVAGMTMTGRGIANGSRVTSVNLGTNTITVSDNAAETASSTNYKVCNVLARLGAENGFQSTVYSTYGMFDEGDQRFIPLDPPQIMPSVVCWTSSGTPGVGTKIWNNERYSALNSFSFKSGTATVGRLGYYGGSFKRDFSDANTVFLSGLNKGGDFWLAALVVYNTTLTERQRAYVSAMLYDRFNIDPDRGRDTQTTVFFMGDSIISGYTCLGIDGMANVASDIYPKVRSLNYSVPGSQVGQNSGGGSPSYGFTSGLFTQAVVPHIQVTPGRKVVVICGGGNDMISRKLTMADDVTAFTFTSFAGGGTITTTANHGLVVGGRVLFTAFSGGTGVTPGAVYWVKTTPTAATFTISSTPGGATITFTGTPTATMESLPKTAASIYTDLLVTVDAANDAGIDQVYVCQILPRVGNEYNFILDDFNAEIAAGAVANNYKVIDLFSIFPNHDNPDGTIDTANFADAGHPNRTGHIVAGNAIASAIAGDL